MSAVEQPRRDDRASLHWMACYDDYCHTHRQMKDNNYYPARTTAVVVGYRPATARSHTPKNYLT